MRKLLIVLFVIGCGSNAMAQSMLKVRLADSSLINISVDGRYFNKRGPSYSVGDLPPGAHNLVIYSLQLDRWGRGHEEAIFRGRVKTHDGMVTFFVYDSYNDHTDISETDLNTYLASHPPHRNGQHFRDNDGGSRDNDYNRGNNDQGGNNGELGNNNNTPPPAPPAQGTVTDSKMSDLKTKMDARATDVEKTNLLKDELANDKITTAQVSTIMDWFIFESSKVDFAKWAYAITVDPESYPDLLNKFAYKASQDDLTQFLNSKK